MIVCMFLVLDLVIAADSKLYPGKSIELQSISKVENKPQLRIEPPSSRDDRSMYNALGEIMVFDSGTWNVYPKCKSCGKFQNIDKFCPNKDEYLNLCGECVGGKSEKDDDFGLDSCGICGGFERCKTTLCEDDNFEDSTSNSTNSCSKTIGVWPKVIDMAGTSRGSVRLVGATSELVCNFNDEESDLGNVETTESDFGVEFKFDLPVLEGKLEMHCNSSENVDLSTVLTLVDTKHLTPFSVDKNTIEFGRESKVTISVGNMRVLTDILCFAKDGDNVVYKYWSDDVEGNSLSTKIVCGKLWPNKVGLLKIGVAYSEEAVLLAKTIDVKVTAKDFVLLRHVWSSGDVLTLYFDQTIASFSSCEDVLNGVSNEDAKCWCSGHEINVKFKGSFKLTNGNLDVKAVSASTGIQKSFAVKLSGFQTPQPLTVLQIKGPEEVCAGSEISFSVDQTAVKWALAISNYVSTNLSLSLEQQRRQNILLWQSMRGAKKYLKIGAMANSVTLDTAFLKPGIEYQIRAKLLPVNGNTIAASKNFKVVADLLTQPTIVGRDSISWTDDVLYEVDHNLCGDKTSNVEYEWTLTDQNELNIRQHGATLRLKGGVLSPNAIYNLTVRQINGSQPVNQASLEIKTEPARLNFGSYIEEIVYGTGHTIILFANDDTSYPSSKDRKYEWSCFSYGSPCIMPGKKRMPVESLGGTDSGTLTLPAGSLPIGTYAFTLKISLPSGEWTSKTTVIKIVPGEPALLSLDSVEITPTLKLNLRASDIVGNCEISLESLRNVNYGYVDFSNKTNVIKLTASPQEPQSQSISITVPNEELTFGTTYIFLFSTQCTAPISSSWLKVVVPLPEKSSCCELKVTRIEGSSQPKFNFNAVDCCSTNTLFTFGFKFQRSIYYLVTSAIPNQELYSFPGAVKPVMKSCEPEKICSEVFGEEIMVEGAATVNEAAIASIMNDFNRNLKAGNKDLVRGNAALLTELAKRDAAVHKNVSSAMMKTLMIRIGEVENNLDVDIKVIPDALDLLDCALVVMKSVEATDEDVSKILEFRDKLDEKSSQSKESEPVPKSTEPLEPRRKRRSIIQKRGVDPIEQVKTFYKADVEGLSKLTNVTMLKNRANKFLKKLPTYIVNVCNDLRNEKPVYSGSTSASLSVARMRISSNASVPFCVPNCDNTTGQVVFRKPTIVVSNKTQQENIVSVCVGSSYFQRDYYSVARDVSSENNITRWSGVFGSFLYLYSGNKILMNNTNNHTHHWSLADVTIPIYNTSYTHLGTLKCHSWLDEVGWNYEPCKTKSVINGTSNNASILCECPIPGIYAAFVVGNSSSVKPAAVVTELPSIMNVTFGANVISTTTTTTKPTTQAISIATMITQTTTPTTKATIPPLIVTTTPATTVTVTNVTTTVAQSTKMANNSNTLNASTAATRSLVTAPNKFITSTMPTTNATAKTTTELPSTTTFLPLPSISPQDFKMEASFMINDEYSEAIKNKKQEFESSIKKQLTTIINIHEETRIEAANNEGKIEVILKVDSADKSNLPLLNKFLNDGTLSLKGLNNKTLTIPKQNIKLTIGMGERTSTVAIITSAVFISAALVLAILLSGIFLKWKRQQRALSFIQNMEISAPKYLRLQETSYIEQTERTGSSENLRSGDLDSGIVLTVDPARVSTKYYPGRSAK